MESNVIEKLRQLNLELGGVEYERAKLYERLNKYPEHNASGKGYVDSRCVQEKIVACNKKIEELKRSINLLRSTVP